MTLISSLTLKMRSGVLVRESRESLAPRTWFGVSGRSRSTGRIAKYVRIGRSTSVHPGSTFTTYQTLWILCALAHKDLFFERRRISCICRVHTGVGNRLTAPKLSPPRTVMAERFILSVNTEPHRTELLASNVCHQPRHRTSPKPL